MLRPPRLSGELPPEDGKHYLDQKTKIFRIRVFVTRKQSKVPSTFTSAHAATTFSWAVVF